MQNEYWYMIAYLVMTVLLVLIKVHSKYSAEKRAIEKQKMYDWESAWLEDSCDFASLAVLVFFMFEMDKLSAGAYHVPWWVFAIAVFSAFWGIGVTGQWSAIYFKKRYGLVKTEKESLKVFDGKLNEDDLDD